MSIFNTPNGTVLTFGELLLRISLDGCGKWLKQKKFPFFIGGAELNVASALALWSVPVRYFTAMPDNDMSREITLQLESQKIDTTLIQFSGDRLGIYYLSEGKDLKHDALIYDRSGSSFAGLQPGTINWDAVLEGVSWFHFSAICPAISENTASLCIEVLDIAALKGITISIDLNYRSKLWKWGKHPNEVMPSLLNYCDVIMGNIWAADIMLKTSYSDGVEAVDFKDGFLERSWISSKALATRFPKCLIVANTFRFEKEGELSYYASLYTHDKFHRSSVYEARNVVNKVGSGDCFMAGLIYGLYNKLEFQQTLEFATAAAFTKLFVRGDATTVKTDQIMETIKNER